jgi:O-6-methylguanine DNA methyltransferase
MEPGIAAMMRVVADTGDVWRRHTWTTPLGPFTVVFTRKAVVAATFRAPSAAIWFQRPVDPGLPPPWLCDLVGRAWREGLGDVAWCLVDPGLTRLEALALGYATTIPFGTTCAYGELARRMGYPGLARLVGRAMGRSPAALLIPTHRVVRADGTPAPSERGGIADALRRYEQSATAGAPR